MMIIVGVEMGEESLPAIMIREVFMEDNIEE